MNRDSSLIGRCETVSMFLLLFQCFLIGLYFFGDIGFDHPGRYGLDFTQGVIIIVAYLSSLVVGVLCSLGEKNWLTGGLQIVIVMTVLGYENRPVPRYNAASYQYLIDMTREEVESELASKGAVTGVKNQSEFAEYLGMTVYYSADGRVARVVPNER